MMVKYKDELYFLIYIKPGFLSWKCQQSNLSHGLVDCW